MFVGSRRWRRRVGRWRRYGHGALFWSGGDAVVAAPGDVEAGAVSRRQRWRGHGSCLGSGAIAATGTVKAGGLLLLLLLLPLWRLLLEVNTNGAATASNTLDHVLIAVMTTGPAHPTAMAGIQSTFLIIGSIAQSDIPSTIQLLPNPLLVILLDHSYPPQLVDAAVGTRAHEDLPTASEELLLAQANVGVMDASSLGIVVVRVDHAVGEEEGLLLLGQKNLVRSLDFVDDVPVLNGIVDWSRRRCCCCCCCCVILVIVVVVERGKT